MKINKPNVEFNTHKIIEAKKNGDKDWKALCKLMNNAVHDKTMGNVRNIIDVRFVNNEKYYWKWL